MPILIPVIHTVTYDQVIYNVEMCYENNIKNIFLIDHRITDDSFAKMQRYVNDIRNIYSNISIGVNFLQLDTIDAMIKAENMNLDYLWADNSYIESNLDKAKKVIDNQKKVKYFGCVAFKYQKQPKDLEYSCKTAINLMDVITTSGTGTGKPPTIDKIKKMRDYIGNNQLAIASGITAENKKIFDDYVDYYLVASSIIDKDERIIESKLRGFLK